MIEVALGVGLFTALVMALVALVLVAQRLLLPGGEVSIRVNESREIRSRRGEKLVSALHAASIHLPAACGGKATCGQCRVRVISGGGAVLPTETSLLARREVARGVRLACQVTVREALEVRVPDEILGVEHWRCRVRSTRHMSPLIKEIVLELPEGETIGPPTGRYVLVTCTPYRLDYRDIAIADEYADEWDRLGLFGHSAGCDEPQTRAYSMANHPGEKGILLLVVRLAIPPPTAPDAPPGVVSSWIFGLRVGDEVDVAGPYGHFTVTEDEDELIFVGGGAGIAPLRAHVLDQMLRRRPIQRVSLWFGVRNRRELLYAEDFDRLQQEHPNFSWTPALSEPRPGEEWDGETGFIHEVLFRRYLADHPAPEQCRYYLCGPPMMVKAVRAMLDELGVEEDRVVADDFGTGR